MLALGARAQLQQQQQQQPGDGSPHAQLLTFPGPISTLFDRLSFAYFRTFFFPWVSHCEVKCSGYVRCGRWGRSPSRTHLARGARVLPQKSRGPADGTWVPRQHRQREQGGVEDAVTAASSTAATDANDAGHRTARLFGGHRPPLDDAAVVAVLATSELVSDGGSEQLRRRDWVVCLSRPPAEEQMKKTEGKQNSGGTKHDDKNRKRTTVQKERADKKKQNYKTTTTTPNERRSGVKDKSLHKGFDVFCNLVARFRTMTRHEPE